MTNLDTPIGLTRVFHAASQTASEALSRWLGRASIVEFDSIQRVSLAEAASVLQTGEEQPVCFCPIRFEGRIDGLAVFAFDDDSGFLLVNDLLERPAPSDLQWTEIEISAAVETANIICSAILNVLSDELSAMDTAKAVDIMPTPPSFHRDFAECLMETVLLSHAEHGDYEVWLATTTFQLAGNPTNWKFLLLPDSNSATKLIEFFQNSSSRGEDAAGG